MLNNLEAAIKSIIASSTRNLAAEIAQAVRAALTQDLNTIINRPGSAPVRRGPGRPRKDVAAPTPATRPRRKLGGVQRRTSEQVAKDDRRVLTYVQAHPGARSVEIQKELKL